MPLIEAVLRKLECNDCKVTVIVPNKLQGVRFFMTNVSDGLEFHQHQFCVQINANKKASEQNIAPGTIVDSTVVHPAFCEFFLTSHRALQVSNSRGNF